MFENEDHIVDWHSSADRDLEDPDEISSYIYTYVLREIEGILDPPLNVGINGMIPGNFYWIRKINVEAVHGDDYYYDPVKRRMSYPHRYDLNNNELLEIGIIASTLCEIIEEWFRAWASDTPERTEIQNKFGPGQGLQITAPWRPECFQPIPWGYEEEPARLIITPGNYKAIYGPMRIELGVSNPGPNIDNRYEQVGFQARY